METLTDIKTLNDKEKELLQDVLARTGWDLPRATRLLQIPISELKEKIKKHGMKQGLQSGAGNLKPVHVKSKISEYGMNKEGSADVYRPKNGLEPGS